VPIRFNQQPTADRYQRAWLSTVDCRLPTCFSFFRSLKETPDVPWEVAGGQSGNSVATSGSVAGAKRGRRSPEPKIYQITEDVEVAGGQGGNSVATSGSVAGAKRGRRSPEPKIYQITEDVEVVGGQSGNSVATSGSVAGAQRGRRSPEPKIYQITEDVLEALADLKDPDLVKKTVDFVILHEITHPRRGNSWIG